MKKFALFGLLLICLSITVKAQAQQTTINLKPGGYWRIDRDFKRVGNFYGSFAASSPVEVYILDYTNYLAWLKGESFNSAYTSQRTSDGKFNVKLGKGTWFLVVSNTFSWVASKTVGLSYAATYNN